MKVCPWSSLIPHWPQVLVSRAWALFMAITVASDSTLALESPRSNGLERMATKQGALASPQGAHKTCGQCGIREEEGETFNHCSRCKVVTYCSKACQKQHWRGGHKDTCQAASERENAVNKAANKTVDNEEKGPSKTSGKKANKPSKSGGPAAAKEQNQPSSRQVTARVDATGAPLSFGKHDNCAICLDTMRNPIRLPSCGHWYCKECVEGLRQAASAQDSCPVCRAPLPPGPEKLFDEAQSRILRVQRKMERLGRNWSNLPRKLQREVDEVIELLEQAAAQEHALSSQFQLGCFYRDGSGVALAQNWRTAMKWFEKAGSNGYREAQYNLAHMYQYGSGGAPVNFTKAREWYEKAAAQGYAKAQHNLGCMHAKGEGGPQDFMQARYWFEKAAAEEKQTP